MEARAGVVGAEGGHTPSRATPAKLGLRQLLAVGGESALVLLVDRQALPGPEAECDNLGLYGFNCSAQFVVVFDSFQV